MSMSSKTTFLKGGLVWAGGQAPICHAGVLVKGGRIEALVPQAEIDEAAKYADEVIDTKGNLVMPPLSDAHVHSSGGLLRGTENSFPLELWSYYTVNYGRNISEEASKHSVLLTNIEMIRNGIGSYIDHFGQTRRAAVALDAHRQSGLRVGFAPFFGDLPDEDILQMPLDRALAERIAPHAPLQAESVKGLFQELSEDLRNAGETSVVLQAGPNSPQRCSDEYWALWRDLQEGLGIRSHTHLLETVPQSVAARTRWPKGVVHALDEAGLLHDRLSVAHGIWLDPAEKELLAARGVTISFNPVSNAMLGSGRKNVSEDLALGLRIALGTDSSNTGGRHDIFEVMRHCLTSGRDACSDFDQWLSPQDVLIAATQAGARAVGGSAVTGTLEPGSVADLLLLDLEVAGMVASAPNLRSVVVHADARNVHSLMVGGRWLLRNSTIQTIDEQAVVTAANRMAEDIRHAAEKQGFEIAALHEPFKAWQNGFRNACLCSGCGAPNFSSFVQCESTPD